MGMILGLFPVIPTHEVQQCRAVIAKERKGIINETVKGCFIESQQVKERSLGQKATVQGVLVRMRGWVGKG